MRGARVLATVLMVVSSGGTVLSQSLADVARNEEERRKAITTPSKVYTNADLRPGRGSTSGTLGPTPTISSGGVTTTTGDGATAAEPGEPAAEDAAPGEVRDQAFWRDRMTAARQQVDRTRVLVDAVQTRVNSLNADFVNVDDPALRAVIAGDRERALAELDRLNEELSEANARIAEIEDEARRASVPPGWLR
jgi:hypothetical protein